MMSVPVKKGAAFYDSIDTLSQWGFQKNTCDRCGKHNSEIDGHLMQCSHCKNRYHCSVACFNEDIPEHSKWCQQVGFLRTAPRDETNKEAQKAIEPNMSSDVEMGAGKKERRSQKRPQNECKKLSVKNQSSKFDEKLSAADLFFRWNNSTDSAFFSIDDVEAWASCQVEDFDSSNHSIDSNRSNTVPVRTTISEEDVEYFRESENDSDASKMKTRKKKKKHVEGGERSREKRPVRKKEALRDGVNDLEKSPTKKTTNNIPAPEVGNDLEKSPRKNVGSDNERSPRRKVTKSDHESSPRAKKEVKTSETIYPGADPEKSPRKRKVMRKSAIGAGNRGSEVSPRNTDSLFSRRTDVPGSSPSRKKKTTRNSPASETGNKLEEMSPRKTTASPTREIRRDNEKSPVQKEKSKKSLRKIKTSPGMSEDTKTGMVVVFDKDSSFAGYDFGDDSRDLDFFLGGAAERNKSQATVVTDAATGVLTDAATGEVQAKSQTANQSKRRLKHRSPSRQYRTINNMVMEERADEVVRAIDEVLSQSSASCQSSVVEKSPVMKRQERDAPGDDMGEIARDSTNTQSEQQNRRPSITRKFGDMDLGACAYVSNEPKKTNIVRSQSITRKRGVSPEKKRVVKSPGKRLSLQERDRLENRSSPRRLSVPIMLQADLKDESEERNASLVNNPKGRSSQKLEDGLEGSRVELNQVSSRRPGKRQVISACDTKKDDYAPSQEYAMDGSPRKLKARSPIRTRSRLSRSPSKRNRIKTYSNVPRAEESEPATSVPDWVLKSPLKQTSRGLRLRTDGSISPLKPHVQLDLA